MESEDEELDEQPFDPLLGQQRMVADPRISAAQAATILGKTVEHVHRLMALGRLPRHGRPNTFWQLRLSDVERLRDRGEPVPLKEAARLLRCTTDDVRKLIADGKLTAVRDRAARSTCLRSKHSPRTGTCHRGNRISLCRPRAA